MPLRTIARISEDLRNLGVRPGDTLMVHSSLKSMGHVPGGAKTAIRGLLEALGDEGTLLMPALSYMDVSPDQPVFDPERTPSCVGVIPELFRTRPRTNRSIHPTHSVCGTGPRAGKMLANHVVDTSPVGEYSPFRLLPLMGGRILMLGCGLRPNTSMHGIEELSVPPYLFLQEAVTYVIRHQSRDFPVHHKRHGFQGHEQRYDRLPEVMERGLLRGKVLEADSWLIDAEPMWEVVDRKLRQDPLFFVDKRER
jgi:aminoglycoside 3-N-acetyltransferase